MTNRVPVGKLCPVSLVCAAEPNFKMDNKVFLLCNVVLTETLLKPICYNVLNWLLAKLWPFGHVTLKSTKFRSTRVTNTRKYQESIHENENKKDGRYFLAMKGVPERILDLCSTIYINGLDWRMNNEMREAFNSA